MAQQKTIIGIGFLISVSYEQVIIFLETYASRDGDINNPNAAIILVSITPIFALRVKLKI